MVTADPAMAALKIGRICVAVRPVRPRESCTVTTPAVARPSMIAGSARGKVWTTTRIQGAFETGGEPWVWKLSMVFRPQV